MSRTDNTMPGRIQEADGKHACWTMGGSYRGIGMHCRSANRKVRRRVNVQLRVWPVKEVDVSQARHGEKYVYW